MNDPIDGGSFEDELGAARRGRRLRPTTTRLDLPAAHPCPKRTKLSNTDPLTDPRKRELQYRCHHDYVVDGLSYSAISRRTGIDEHVVSAYVRIEADRRAVEREANRAAEIDRSIAIFNGLVRHYTEKMEQPGARGDEGRYVLQARIAHDALLGLNAPIKVKDETPRAPLVGVSSERVARLLLLAVAAKS